MKFGMAKENHMPMAVKRSKSKPEVEFQDGGRLFSETGSNVGRGLRYLVEIWYADSLGPSDIWEVAKPETGSRFVTPWPPFCKINMTS